MIISSLLLDLRKNVLKVRWAQFVFHSAYHVWYNQLFHGDNLSLIGASRPKSGTHTSSNSIRSQGHGEIVWQSDWYWFLLANCKRSCKHKYLDITVQEIGNKHLNNGDRKFADQYTTRKGQSSYAIKQRINDRFTTGKSRYCRKVKVEMFVPPNNWLGDHLQRKS